MIIVHHLNNSRSQRILWALEEMGIDYEIRHYQRDAVTNLAPPELKAIHPLGKSPVIEDKGQIIAESSAILDYLARNYGQGKFAPKDDSPDFYRYQYWLHFAEGSVMTPLLLALYVGRLGEAGAPLHPRIDSEIKNHFDYMEAELGKAPYFVGNDLTAGDFAMSFPVEIAKGRGMIQSYPHMAKYLAGIQARPAYQQALKKGGEYAYA